METIYPHVFVHGPNGMRCYRCGADRELSPPLHCADTILQLRVKELASKLIGYAIGITLDEAEAHDAGLAWNYRQDARDILRQYPHLLSLDLREHMESRGFQADPQPKE